MALFDLGKVVATPGVLDAIDPGTGLGLLVRHQEGDWGDVEEFDTKSNWEAVRNDERIMSSYNVEGETIWIITEWNRSVTTLLLPDRKSVV